MDAPPDPLAVKDIATLMLSGAALLTSVSVALFNVYAHFIKKGDDARKAFEEALLGIVAAKQGFEALRHEAGENFEDPKYFARRVALVDTRNFNLAKATQAFKAAKYRNSSADNLLLASALMESGRRGASVAYYQRAVDLASDPYDTASALRVLGRAQILSGQPEVGRATMLRAVDLYSQLADDSGYERVRMFDEVAETFRRLINSQVEIGSKDHLESDLTELERAAGQQRGGRAQSMMDFAADIRSRVLGQSPADAGPTPAADA